MKEYSFCFTVDSPEISCNIGEFEDEFDFIDQAKVFLKEQFNKEISISFPKTKSIFYYHDESLMDEYNLKIDDIRRKDYTYNNDNREYVKSYVSKIKIDKEEYKRILID